ncbi:MAG: DNA repair protein RadA, partial [Acidimicrobiales bacterium]
AVVLAVLGQHAGASTAEADVFTLAAGGVKVVEPAADLALALAVASAVARQPLPPPLVACGEVGLGGELRQVAHTARRLAEAARLGFEWALLPPSAPDPPAGMRAVRASTLAEAVVLASVAGHEPRPVRPAAHRAPAG